MDNTFVPLRSPVGSLMRQIESRMRAREALEMSATLTESARATNNPHLRRKAAEHLLEFDREAEALQLGE